jgi:hypothetical protein
MDIKKKYIITELSDSDRKVIDKYTKFYTNFIESNSEQNEVLDDENFNRNNK